MQSVLTSRACKTSISALILFCSASYTDFSGLPLPYTASSICTAVTVVLAAAAVGVEVPVEGDEALGLPAPLVCLALAGGMAVVSVGWN